MTLNISELYCLFRELSLSTSPLLLFSPSLYSQLHNPTRPPSVHLMIPSEIQKGTIEVCRLRQYPGREHWVTDPLVHVAEIGVLPVREIIKCSRVSNLLRTINFGATGCLQGLCCLANIAAGEKPSGNQKDDVKQHVETEVSNEALLVAWLIGFLEDLESQLVSSIRKSLARGLPEVQSCFQLPKR